ncbi:MAG: hypothetical protein A4E63_02860 [Syntrophorhabdus sp. PtaU1.Bin050]|nr:MAG: hypothetical protein A4E63_02860 [Syntrophorhabdus sp. PtaU1.Bin050]
MVHGSNKHSILKETIGNIRRILGDRTINELCIERAVRGFRFNGVKLNNGFGGICYILKNSITKGGSCPDDAEIVPDSRKPKGMPVSVVLEEMFNGNFLKRTLGIAAINALSNTVWSLECSQEYEIVKNADAIDNIEIKDSDYVVLVGALPYRTLLKDRGKPFCVLELDPSTFEADELPFYVPAEKAPEKVPLADVLIITGSTLVNDTLEDLLELAKPTARIAMYGPTASMLPEAFFQRGVKIIGGFVVTKPDEFLNALGRDGSGHHLFGESHQKVVIKPK